MINPGSGAGQGVQLTAGVGDEGPEVRSPVAWPNAVEHRGADGDSAAAEDSALDLADIQGFILRGYRMPMVRHFLLTEELRHKRARSSDGS